MKFKYSFKKELGNARDMVKNPGEYKGLRSVVWPSFSQVSYLRCVALGYLSILPIYLLWLRYEKEVRLGFKKVGLEFPKVNCYLYNFGCEGWFDTDDQSIHTRFTKTNYKEILETIIHESVHLSTYKPEDNYVQREKIVDDYLEKMDFKFINFKRQRLSYEEISV